MCALGEALVVLRHRLDEKALALGLRADGAPALDRFGRLLRLRRSRAGSEGVADEEGRDAPSGDGATRVALKHLAKRVLAFTPPERVQQGDGAFKSRLHGGSGGIGERNGAELLGRLPSRLGPCGGVRV